MIRVGTFSCDQPPVKHNSSYDDDGNDDSDDDSDDKHDDNDDGNHDSNGTTTPGTEAVAPHRQAGATAYLKPNLDSGSSGIIFEICDAQGKAADHTRVEFDEDFKFPLGLRKAHVECVAHFDEKETERVRTYNLDLGIYWARFRLLQQLTPGGGEVHVADSAASGHITNELVKLETCGQRILEFSKLLEGIDLKEVRGVTFADHARAQNSD